MMLWDSFANILIQAAAVVFVLIAALVVLAFVLRLYVFVGHDLVVLWEKWLATSVTHAEQADEAAINHEKRMLELTQQNISLYKARADARKVLYDERGTSILGHNDDGPL